jgi:hypothetical protein
MEKTARLQTLAALLLAGCAWLFIDPATVRESIVSWIDRPAAEEDVPGAARAEPPDRPEPDPRRALVPTIVVVPERALRDLAHDTRLPGLGRDHAEVLRRILEDAARDLEELEVRLVAKEGAAS